MFKANAESNSAAGTRVATNLAAQGVALAYGSVRLESEALLLTGGVPEAGC